MTKRVAAAILAGGQGTRMKGVIKPNILIAGETVLSRTLNKIKGIFDEIIIVTDKPEEFTKYAGCIITSDQFQGIGPLGGIHAALKAASSETIFVMAGDMPLLSNELIKKQIDLFGELNCDILVPKTGNFMEPLHSVYSINVLKRLEAYLNRKGNNAVREFFMSIDTRYMELDESEDFRIVFSNINKPADIQELEKIIRRDKDQTIF